MNYHTITKFACGFLSLYFVASGMGALFDIDAKLDRIGLAATNPDGTIAFILIYCSLMIGIGIAMAAMALVLKSAGPSLILASAILLCFILFRFVGSAMLGYLTQTQIAYIVTEIIELSIVLFLLYKTGALKQRAA